MTNIDDARDFMITRGDEEAEWYTFLKTKASQDLDDQDMHEAARQAVRYFYREYVRGMSTPDLVEVLVTIYRSQGWELDGDSLVSIPVDAITEQIELRHDTSAFCEAYADRAEQQHFDSVADSNESFVTAWTDEILRNGMGEIEVDE